MASPEVKEKLASIGGDLNVNSPDEFGAHDAGPKSGAGIKLAEGRSNTQGSD